MIQVTLSLLTNRDTLLTLDATGLGDLLWEDKIPFVDLNTQPGITVQNRGGKSKLQTLTFPAIFREVDYIVSLPKMKTHHWAGVTLSMKNLFGVMPGNYYGWPKNVLHFAGLQESILDINATLPTHLAIVDGITGMEGDGPIMGDPVASGMIVFGENFPAVDATASRLMRIDPEKVPYLRAAKDWLGPIEEGKIRQLGEEISHLAHPFKLIDKIPAQAGLRLS
ncbi:MAG: DUF362 domain-containing protein [Armatimonadetes bacterium]|nr:DUF362 domain-containing protein [Akkermansiaceae bacterium]